MARIMVPALLPTTCYVGEVALWLAVGRVPAIYYDDPDQGAEAREDYGAFVERGGPIDVFFYGFESSEFSGVIGKGIDYDRYFSAKECSWHGGDGAEHRALFESQAARFQGADGVDLDELRASVEKEAEDIDWALALDAHFWPLVDAARAEVFLALHRGDLTAMGWPSAPPDDPSDEQLSESKEMFPIPAAAWTQTNFVWEKSILRCRHPEGEFHAVQVRTADMLAKFPSPAAPVISSATISLYASCGVIGDDGQMAEKPAPVPSRRGRPSKGVSIREIVANMYGDRMRAGTEKSEAIVTEAIEFVWTTCRQRIARSTIQGYLQAAATMPKNVPVIPAE